MKRLVFFAVLFTCLWVADAWGAGSPLSDLAGEEGYATSIKILLLLTALAFLPALVLTMTCFTRLIIVFSLLRHALGTQQAPPTQIMVGLALFLTFFIMQPVWSEVNEKALVPYLNEEMGGGEALEKALVPLRGFMLKQTRKADLGLFVELSKMPPPAQASDIPTTVLIPAFVTSELKTAFEISFLLYIPFLVIDMVVASILMSMGMMLLPPIMISLPFKLMLFVLADGWNMVVRSMVESF
jgi:flagellar biosynthetic protein FliP